MASTALSNLGEWSSGQLVGRLRRSIPLVAAASLLICGTTGCNRRPHTYPVDGKVVYKGGGPVPGGFVAFETELPDKKKATARGRIEPDGTFKLSTWQPGDGAVAGAHRVIVGPPVFGPEEAQHVKTKVTIPVRYQNYDKSGLQFTVTAGSDNHPTLEIDKK